MRAALPGVGVPGTRVRVRFGGRELECRPGDTLAAALLDAGELGCRVTVAGEPRGVFCGMGACQDCLVVVNGEPGQRACMTYVRDDMSIEPQPALPELGALAAAPPAPPVRELAPDLLVVGGGPAGLAAAAAAAEGGLSVVLADERSRLGGQYFKQPAAELALREAELDGQFRAGRALIARVEQAGVDVLAATQVWSAAGPEELHATAPGLRYVLRPARLVLAPGAFERAVPLPGWTLPGVLTTGAAQTLLRAHQVLPGERVLVSGNGPLNLQVAAELARAGARVVALAELARVADPRRAPAVARMLGAAPDLIRDGARYQWALRRRRVPILGRSAVTRIEGQDRVERAVVARIGPDGRPVAGSERGFAVDAVCVGFGFSPANELARALGCRHVFDPRRGQLAAETDARGRSSVENVWAIGDGAGVSGARAAQALGIVAGADVVRSLGGRPSRARAAEARGAARALRRHRRFQDALSRVYAAPRLLDELADDATPICRCEDVTRGAVDAVLDDGVEAVGAVKRLTRAGMGGCQGRYCGPLLAELAVRRSGRRLEEHDWFAPAVPFKPIPVAAIAAAPEV